MTGTCLCRLLAAGVLGIQLAGCALTAAAVPAAPALTFAGTEEYPLQYRTGTQLQGSTVDMVRTLCRRRGGIADVSVGATAPGPGEESRTVMLSMVRTAENETQFRWVGPVALTSYLLTARTDSTPALTALPYEKEKHLIAYAGERGSELLTARGYCAGRYYAGERVALEALQAGEIDLLLIDAVTATEQLRQAGFGRGEVVVSGTIVTEPRYLAFPRETPDAEVAAWQAELVALQREGSFAALYEPYHPGQPVPGEVLLLVEHDPPLAYATEHGIDGLYPEAAREVMRRTGMAASITLLERADARELAEHHPYVALAGLRHTAARDTQYQWAGTVARSRDALYGDYMMYHNGMALNSPRWNRNPGLPRISCLRFNSLDDLKVKPRIAVVAHSDAADALRSQGFVNLISCTSAVSAIQLFKYAGADLYLLDEMTVDAALSSSGYRSRSGIIAYPEEFSVDVAFSHATPPAIVKRWRAAMATMETDGTLAEMRTRHLPPARSMRLRPGK